MLRNAGFTHHGRTDLVLYSLVPADLAPGDLTPAGPVPGQEAVRRTG
ncbi:hypothetical protein ACFU6K_31870 [Kitasatospora sp. NPDC057512]